MKLKVILLGLVIGLFVFNCKQIKKEENADISQTVKAENRSSSFKKSENIISVNKTIYNFDNVIKCEKYDYRPENIYSWGDYGCLYAPDDNNKYGNLIIYLIPKIGINKYYQNFIGEEDENIDSEFARINSLSILEIKQEFHIYLSLIDKKYLEHTPTLDASYNIKQSEGDNYKFKLELYNFDDKSKSWELLDFFETLQKTSNKAWEWEQKKIREIINNDSIL